MKEEFLAGQAFFEYRPAGAECETSALPEFYIRRSCWPFAGHSSLLTRIRRAVFEHISQTVDLIAQ